MNKAFVREPDAQEDLCPHCGSAGQPVSRRTVARYAGEAQAKTLAEPANFCPKPTCDVAYFDGFERFLTTGALSAPIYPKDPSAPICACFGLTEQDIDLDLAEGGKERTKRAVERAKSAEARCEAEAPNGRSCVAVIQRYFQMRLQQAQRDAGR